MTARSAALTRANQFAQLSSRCLALISPRLAAAPRSAQEAGRSREPSTDKTVAFGSQSTPASSLPQEHDALPVHEPVGERLERFQTGGLLRENIDGRVEPAELRRV